MERLLKHHDVPTATAVVNDIDPSNTCNIISHSCDETASPELPRTCPNNDDNEYNHESSRFGGRRSTYGGGNLHVGRYEMSPIATSDTVMFYDGMERSLTMDSLDVTEQNDNWLQNDNVEDALLNDQDYPEQQDYNDADVMESFRRLSVDHQSSKNKKQVTTNTSKLVEKTTKNPSVTMGKGHPGKQHPQPPHPFPPLPRGTTNNKRPRRQIQTTVSFFYDSNEEISDDDNFDNDDDISRSGDEESNGKSRPRLAPNSIHNTMSTTPPSTVKNALGLHKKSIKEFLGRKAGTVSINLLWHITHHISHILWHPITRNLNVLSLQPPFYSMPSNMHSLTQSCCISCRHKYRSTVQCN